MFDGLSARLSDVLDKLTRRGSLTEGDVTEAMREIRRALIEADVALDVIKSFIDRVRSRAIGTEVLRSVTPGQMVVKIVNDELIATLGAEASGIDLESLPPVPILMVGLQGSGKTTTTAKIARRLTDKFKKKVLLASLDTRRPAAMEQLAILGQQVGVAVLPIVAGQSAVQIANRAMDAARLGGYDVVMLDTAGRTTVDEALMIEVADVKSATSPHEILLVADALTGQDAVNTARAFDSRLGITGIVLTRLDGDGRGGAALSMRAVTGKPIKLVGTGEKVDALEEFHPARIANRILGMGDVVSLVERAAETIDAEKAAKIADKMQKGRFDLDDLREQLAQMEKIGGMSGILGLLPGMGRIKEQIASANIDDRVFRRQRAIIDSMTPEERRKPEILKASRKRRIAAGSGTSPEQINKLLKMHQQMATMMKQMGGAKKGALGKMASMFGLGGGMPSIPADAMDALSKGALPPGMPGLPPQMPDFSKMPGLPGFPDPGSSRRPGGPPPGFPFGSKKK